MGQRLVLCDTSIFVGVIRKHEPTRIMLEKVGHDNVVVSVVTLMELILGAQSKTSLEEILNSMRRYESVELSNYISAKALKLMKDYHLSHKLDIPDALIAATAIELKLPLLTLNLKDFRYLPGIELVSM